jgi:hypothetical protein
MEAGTMNAAFDTAQATYDAAEPDDERVPPYRIDGLLESLVEAIDRANEIDDSQEVYRLSDRQATVGIWIDGHEYSLTLNRED